MKFLKSWLQDYIVETLPKNEVVVEALNKKSFEVEEIILLGDDTIFDIKVLPNRAHDALGHVCMAKELCADLGLTFKKDDRIKKSEAFFDANISPPIVEIDDEKACTRFMSMRIDGIKVGPSPKWLKERLEAIGQRSINNIVDVTNYIQFSLNKPMHAYDARSIKGTLRARFAKKGEILTTLDDKELKLDKATLVIADDEKTLGLAGIKGGKYCGIESDTTSVILESANFEPTLIRKTAQKYDIHTDASKRFENGIANSLIEDGLYMTANIIKEISKKSSASNIVDVYPKKDTEYYVGISLKELNDILGTSYQDEDVVKTLNHLLFKFEKIIPQKYIQETYPKLVGAKYKNPSSMRYDAPGAFSCSSLVSYLYKGIWMPSLSIDKYVFSEKIKEKDLRFGDLVFANTGEGIIRFESIEFLRGTKVKEGVDHVGMYLGDNKIIHATKIEKKVVIQLVEEFSKNRKIIGYGRILDGLEEERYVVQIPPERLDLRMKEDMAEEIGRIIGYDKLIPTLPKFSQIGLLPKRTHYENKIREILLKNGFSEVITYSFGSEGEVSLVKGLADDKEKLRTNIGEGMLKSLQLNLYNAPLLGQKIIKLFEFGNVFSNNSESRHFSLAIDDGAKKSNFTESIEFILIEIKRALGLENLEYITFSVKPYVIEIDFDTLISTLPESTNYEEPTFASLPIVHYKTVSPYPFIVRDIAMWVPNSTTWEGVSALCSQVRNPLVARVDLFDTFSKEIGGVKKTSIAFRIVFQSYEKTLTDEEVNKMMEKYYEVFKEKNYEIR